jgi:hypothetical protein
MVASAFRFLGWVLLLLAPSRAAQAQADPPWEAEPDPLRVTAGDGATTVVQQKSRLVRLSSAGGDRPSWQLALPLEPLAIGLYLGGDVAVLGSERLLRVRADGTLQWNVPLSGDSPCGYPNALAVGYRNEVLVSCGYSLLRFDEKGVRKWQKWPAGNASVSAPYVDQRGHIYVSGDGTLLALAETGDPLWTFDAAKGFPHPRHIGPLGFDRHGALLFVSRMNGLHSPTDGRGVRRYYVRKPPRLVVIDRDSGKLLREQDRESSLAEDPPWPASQPLAPDGAHRLPERVQGR